MTPAGFSIIKAVVLERKHATCRKKHAQNRGAVSGASRELHGNYHIIGLHTPFPCGLELVRSLTFERDRRRPDQKERREAEEDGAHEAIWQYENKAMESAVRVWSAGRSAAVGSAGGSLQLLLVKD